MKTIRQNVPVAGTAMLGLGVYRPSGSSPTTRSARSSTPPTSGSRPAPASGPAASPARARRCIGMSTAAASRRPGGRRGVARSRSAASSSPPPPTPSTRPPPRPRSPTALGSTAAGLRHLRRLRGLLPRARPGLVDGALAALERATCWSSASSSSAASWTRPTGATAFIFADGAGAVVVGAVRRARHRADCVGLGRLSGACDHADARAASARSPRVDHPVVQMEGTAVFRWAPFAMAKVRSEALDAGRAGRWTTSTPSSRTRPTCGSPQTLSQQHQASRVTSRSPPTSSTRATPRRPRSRWPWRRCCARARRRPATPALLIAFGAGLSYAGQVVTLPPLGTA